MLTLALLLLLWLISRALRTLMRAVFGKRQDVAARFWSRQGIHIALTVLGVLIFASIWFDRPGRFTNAAGLITAGLAVALGRVVTALAGYFVILRSRTFNVGDRIAMGGVRGDVVALSFLRTTILEMGQAPGEAGNAPDVWVGARQYTGRVVTVTNDKVFNEPVYNYSRDFPYIFEEMRIPIKYDADRARAEQILLDAARTHTTSLSELGSDALAELRRRYFITGADLEPRVYYRMTDNWLELAVRFLAPTHGVRELKDKLTRDILRGFEVAGLQVASTTIEVVGLPQLSPERATIG